MKTICFWLNHLGERGMCVSTYDYAYYNEKILNNKSIILHNADDASGDPEVLNKFTAQFEIYRCRVADIDSMVATLHGDLLYILKHGKYDDFMYFKTKTAIHAVFEATQPHGDIFAVISSEVNGANHLPIVPHMINLPTNTETMRAELNIPEHALVFGRHGGYDQFNMDFVHNAVLHIALSQPNVYFVFMNTRPFCQEMPNIIHIAKTIDLEKKTAFINTCDAMIWGRSGGETFGLSIGEFSSRNKPVFCMDIGSRAHVNILGEKAVVYTRESLYNQMVTFIGNYKEMKNRDWNAYKEFTPENVMHIFNKVFIETDNNV